MEKFTFKNIVDLFRQTSAGFMKDKVTKLSASLAYYTIFSLGPMLIVILYISGLVWKREAVSGNIFTQIRSLVGDNAALQIQDIIKSASVSGNNSFAAIIGVVTLIIGATTIFAEIQDSINTIWKLKVNAKKGWLMMLKDRALSFSLVISLGFLLLVSLIINSVVEGLMNNLKSIFPEITVIFVYILNLAITLLITSALFAIIFKVLPDAVIRWKDVAVGAVFTALLFMIGKFGITFYISSSNVGSAYGTAGSLVILLLWIYYSSIILYFGAEFTKFYAVKFGSEIIPKDYAVMIQTVQVESNHTSVKQNEEASESIEKELQNTTNAKQAE